MDINEDYTAFYEWSVLMGCPVNLIPSLQVMQSTLRGRTSIVMDMVKKVRPREEVKQLRNTLLIHRMQKLKDKDLPKSILCHVPEPYQRYETMRETNDKISEQTKNVDRLRTQSGKMMEKIRDLSIKKAQLQQLKDESLAKQKIMEAKSINLTTEMEHVRVQDEAMKYNSVVLPTEQNVNESLARESLERAKSQLQDFYKQQEFRLGFVQPEAKESLFKAIRRTVESHPNLSLYKAIKTSIESEVENLHLQKHEDISSPVSDRSGRVEDGINREISASFQRLVHRAIQLDSQRDALSTINDTYERLFTDLNQSLEDSTVVSMREEFITEYSRLFLNEGRVRFLQSEIAGNKEILRERSRKMREMMDSQGLVKEYQQRIRSEAQAMVNDLKQLKRISGQLNSTRKLTEEYMDMMRGDFKPGAKIYSVGTKPKTLGLEVPEDVKGIGLVEDLKILKEMPMGLLNTLDEGQKFKRNAPVLMFTLDTLRASHYGHMFTVEGFLRDLKDVCDLQSCLQSAVKGQKELGKAVIEVNIDAIRYNASRQNDGINQILRLCEQDLNSTEDSMEKCKIYYDILMKNPLKKFIPTDLKVEGKTFAQMENEFLLYYRMICGEKGSRDLD